MHMQWLEKRGIWCSTAVAPEECFSAGYLSRREPGSLARDTSDFVVKTLHEKGEYMWKFQHSEGARVRRIACQIHTSRMHLQRILRHEIPHQHTRPNVTSSLTWALSSFNIFLSLDCWNHSTCENIIATSFTRCDAPQICVCGNQSSSRCNKTKLQTWHELVRSTEYGAAVMRKITATNAKQHFAAV